MKRIDIWIIIFLLAIATILFGVFKTKNEVESSQKYAEITYKGKLIQTIPLHEGNIAKKIPIKTELGVNTVETGEGKIRIVTADCPDQICVKTGWITNIGQTLVCLPHKLVVEIKGDEINDEDSYSY